MQTYDIIMLVVLAGAVLFGWWKGFAWQVASLAAIFVSYFVAFEFREPVAEMIKAKEPWNKFLAMLLLFLGTSLVIWITFGFVSRTIEKMRLKDFDRHAGAALGGVKGVLLCLVITFFAVTLLRDAQKKAICDSKSGYYMAQLIDHLDAIMPKEVHRVVQPYLNKLDQELEKNEAGESDSKSNDLDLLDGDLLNDIDKFLPQNGAFSGSSSGAGQNGKSTQPNSDDFDWKDLNWRQAAETFRGPNGNSSR